MRLQETGGALEHRDGNQSVLSYDGRQTTVDDQRGLPVREYDPKSNVSALHPDKRA